MIDDKAWPEGGLNPEVNPDPKIDATIENVNRLVSEAVETLKKEAAMGATGTPGPILGRVMAEAAKWVAAVSLAIFIGSVIAIPAEVEMAWSIRIAAWSAILFAASAVVCSNQAKHDS